VSRVGRRAAAGLGAALLLAACDPPLVPVTPPHRSMAGAETRIEAMQGGTVGEARAVTGGLQLRVHLRGASDARLERTLLTRVTRSPCSGGAPAVAARVDDLPPARLPVPVGNEHTLVLGFLPTPEEALEGPTALDLEVASGGYQSCVRTELGPARDWQRQQLAVEVDAGVAFPLRTLGDLGTPWTFEARVGALLGHLDVSGGLRLGVSTCAECSQNTAVLTGPALAATLFPFTERPLALGVKLSYASLFELVHVASDASSSAAQLREVYQVPGVALQLDWLGPPRGSRVRLRGRDFSDWGIEVFDQLWIPTVHADRPATVLGVGLVSRLAL
jgi:hypothetical protein